MKKAGIVAVVTAAALALSACSGSADKKSDSSSKATKVAAADYLHAKYDELKEGGTLTLPVGEVTAQANTFQADGSQDTREVWKFFNPQIVLFSDEGEFQKNPAYLDDVKEEEVDGNTVVTYTINEKASFNDGTPIDVKAFQTTWKDDNGENEEFQTGSTDGYSQIKSVEAGANDKEVVVTFNGIYAWWQGLFNLILHPEIDTPDEFNNYYTSGNVDDYNKYGAGPYKLETYDTSQGKIVFVPNEKWWGNPAKLEKVTLIQMEPSASINAFSNGEIDAVSAANAERLEQAKKVEGAKIYQAMATSNALFMINSKSPALGDIKVRQAILEGIDRTKLAAITFQGLDYSEPLPGSFILFPTQDGYHDNFAEAVKYDPKDAAKLLDEAGWAVGSDGIREKDGQKLSLTFPYFGDSTTVKARAQAIQASLKEIGVDVKVEQRASSDFSATYTKRDFDLFGMAFSSSDPFGVAYFDQIYNSESQLNLSGTGTPEFDEKIKEMRKIADPKEQIEAANKLEVEAFKTYGIMPLFNGANTVGVKEGLANCAGLNYPSTGFAQIAVENIGWVK